MASAPAEFKVVHRPEKKAFVAQFTDGVEGKLEYDLAGGVVDMFHTEVPPQKAGKGVAGVLTKVIGFEFNLSCLLTSCA